MANVFDTIPVDAPTGNVFDTIPTETPKRTLDVPQTPEWAAARPGDVVRIQEGDGGFYQARKSQDGGADKIEFVGFSRPMSTWLSGDVEFKKPVDVTDEWGKTPGGAVGAALRSAVAETPGVASGTAAFGAAARALQGTPPAVRIGGSLAAGLLGGASGAIAGRPVMERVLPDLAASETEFPNASALGANLAQAPFFRVGGGARLLERGLGAAIGGGVQAGTELVNEAPLDRDALVRTAMATAGGAAFTDPTRLGRGVMNVGAAAVNPITSKLGNASTKNTTVEAQAASNDIALAEPPPPQVPMPDPMSLAALTPQEQPAGAPGALGTIGIDDFGPLVEKKKPKLSRVRGLDVEPIRGTPDEGPTAMEIPTGQEEVQLKEPMVFERAIGGPNPEAQVAVQEAFNKRVKSVTENLAEQGVQIDRQTAVKLARIAKPDEFNRARQQLIDSVGGEVTEIPKKGPIKSLEELPAKVGQDDASVVDDVPEAATKPESVKLTEPEETHVATVVRTAPEPQKLDFVGVQEGLPDAGIPDVELWNISKDIVDKSGRVLHPKGSTMARQTLEGYGIKVPEVPAKAVSEPIKAPEPVKAPETPIVEQKPVKATEQASIAKPASPLASDVLESPLLKPKRAKKVAVDDDAAIEAAAAEQAGKAAPTPETKAPTIPKGADTTSVKTKDGLKTIYKDPKDGNWYDAQGNMLSGGSRQVAIEKIKKGGVQKAGEAGIIYNPFETGTQGRKLSQLNRIDFDVHGDGTYSVDGFSQTGVRSGRPAKYGKTETPQISFRGTEEELRRAFGDAVADKIVKEANNRIFNDAPESVGSKSDIVASGRIEGLTSADFKSKFGTEAGSVLNPFDGEPSELGRRALEVANEPLLRRMAKAEVEASRESDIFSEFMGTNVTEEAPEVSVDFPQSGTGSAPSKTSSEVNKQIAERRKYEGELLPLRDSVTGNEIPENVAKNAKIIYDKMVADAAKNNAAKPTEEVARAVAQAPEQYVPMLSDLASRFPVLDNRVTKPITDRLGVVAKFIREKLGLSEDNIGDVYTPLKGKLYERDHFIGRLTNRLLGETKDLGVEARKTLTRAEFEEYDAANLTGDRDAVMAIFKGKPNEAELVAAYDRNQAAKTAARQMLVEAGRDVGLVDNYFQRMVIDRDGLRKAIGKSDANLWDDAVRDATKKKGSALTPEEESAVMNQLILGSIRGRGGPGFLKERTIETITKDLSRFYEPSDVADARWAMGVAKDVGNRKFFGKIEPDPDGIYTEDSSFGRTVAEGVKSGAVRARGLKIIQDNLRDLYNNQQTHSEAVMKLAGGFRAMQTFAYLADAGTALIQFADIFSIMREYGKHARSAYGPKMPKIEDIGVTEGHNVDVQDLSRMGKANQTYLDKAGNAALAPFRFAMKNLIGKADELQKSASTRAAMKAIASEIDKPDSSFFKKVDSEYSKLFPDRWEKMKESLRSKDFTNGKLDENSSLFLFSELARLQPITATGRAQGYQTAGPLAKSMYALRSYWLKQIGILRNQAYNEAKRGNVLGGFNRLATYMTMVAVGQQAFQYAKDRVLQRDVPEEEYAVGGLMQIAGIPRYLVYRQKQVGTGTAALETLVPGVGVFNDIGMDIRMLGKSINGAPPKTGDIWENLETTKYIPGFGREVYALTGKGKLKEEKERIRKLEGGAPRRTTLQELSNIFSGPTEK